MSSRYYSLITGASEGFGRALAIECARRKMNVILVALPGVELQKLADFIRSNYSVDAVCIEKDLCKDESCAEVFNEVNALGLQVDKLFNNVGTGSTGFFGEGNIELYERQIKLNVLATTLITRLFLDMLKQNSPSYIMNVGSLVSFFSVPKKPVYGATKSFIYYFSKNLRSELKRDQVHVSVLCPGGMNTNPAVRQVIQAGNYLTRLSCMDPEKVAPFAIEGLLKKREVVIPGKLNNLFLLLDWLLPAFIKTMIMDYTMRKLSSSGGSSTLRQAPWQFGQLRRMPVIVKDRNFGPNIN